MNSTERARLDAHMSARIDDRTRAGIWGAVDEILSHGPLAGTGQSGSTGLVLGYVQSGKTTAITATIAAAADAGYRVVIALLGSTNLLLDQNKARLADALGIGSRTDYRWVEIANPSADRGGKEVASWLGRDRCVLIPVLKHAGRINALAGALTHVAAEYPGLPVLIVDDEADQASLNTQVNQGAESRVYEAVSALRTAAPRHVYVQFTATPYAPLLLEADDHLRPDFVVLLQPGRGYTGGREFFVDSADIVIRPIPTLDEQPPRTLPTMLPRSLVNAWGSFVAGSALLLGADSTAAPVSMLVHSTQRNNIQERYRFLLDRLLQQWIELAGQAPTAADLPEAIRQERDRITSKGAADLPDDVFLDKVRYVLREATVWLVNSASELKKVDWNVAPVHVLIGGNKLDRGFTVEGLTVTYMNRPASDQIDTLEQRARAFGYRGDLLPYCQFFATPRTLDVLRKVVDTEYDLRARLEDWIAAGNSVADWANEVGLLLPQGTKPTRQNVLTALSRFNTAPAWHQLRRPSLNPHHLETNRNLVETTGLLSAPARDFGRLQHRTLLLPIRDVVTELLEPWEGTALGQSPGWRHHDLTDMLRRLPDQDRAVPVMLLQHPDGGPRTRRWDPETGFINLMQGRDPAPVPGQGFYPGDRAVFDVSQRPDQIVLQVHHVQSAPPEEVPPLFTLAVHAGSQAIVKRGPR